MSKFSKALEKLQEERESNVATVEKRKPNFEIPNNAEQETAHWERGIPVVKNAKPDTRIVTYHYPTSVLTEQYRMLSHNVKTELAKHGAKVILVSSSVHGEGKTITATNLALALTEMGNSKVALVDADLRRGRVGTYLGLEKGHPGLSGYLANGLTSKQTMVRSSIDNLTIIPCGELTNNPTGLIGSQKFRVLLAELRSRFDYVIVDSPPIMAVADAGILGRDTDGLLMVIQTGRTPKTVIAHANILFKQAGIRMLGYVLTNVEFQSPEYKYYYYSYDQKFEAEENKGFLDRVSGAKEAAAGQLKKMGSFLERKERNFNQWWEHRVLKKDSEEPLSGLVDQEHGSDDEEETKISKRNSDQE
jgi:capsular exopolysaccharide synthesis family protein